jgi:hypothetical protein
MSVPADAPLLVDPNEILHRTVIPGFNVPGKIAGRDFSCPSVGGDAVATDPFFPARVAAIAVHQVPLFFTFHVSKLNFFRNIIIIRRNP